MDFFTAMEVSASGLTAQRTRLNVASSNLANVQTTRGVDGQPYRRGDVVLGTQRMGDKVAGGQAGGHARSAMLTAEERAVTPAS